MPENNETDASLTNKVIELLERESKARIAEKRFSRIRSIILLVPAVLFTAMWFFNQGYSAIKAMGDEYVSYIELNGEISPSTIANSKLMNSAISAAFKDKKAKGVLLRISSPGGSPTQSSLIRDHLDAMQEKYPEKKLIVVAEESMASGAYLIGSGADVIYSSKSTILGSIGVILEGWDFSEAIDKFDVKHRLFIAGENKARLNPFEKLTDADIDKTQKILDTIHQQFISYVKDGRGDKLSTEHDLFTGDFWIGSEAQKLGLVDKFGGVRTALQDEFGTQRVSNYTPQLKWHQKFGGQLGASISEGLFGRPEILTIY